MAYQFYRMDANNGNPYHPSWYNSNNPQVSTTPQIYNQHSGYEQAKGWNFRLPLDGPWYPEGYGIYEAPEPDSDPSRQETPVENFLPRTSIFEFSEPVVLTTLDESGVHKYIPYVVESSVGSKTQRLPFSEADRFSDPEFHKIEETEPQMEINSFARPPEKTDETHYQGTDLQKHTFGSKLQDIQEETSMGSDRSAQVKAQTGHSEIESQVGQHFPEIGPPKWRRINENQPKLPYKDMKSYEKEFFIFYTLFKDRTFPLNLPRSMTWYNVPEKWELYDASGGLLVFPKPGSDFWQQTYFGKSENKDSGHLLYVPCTHNKFLLETLLTLSPRHQNDQAGVMVRYDQKNWVKAGLEFIQGQFKLTCICTIKGFSDWSVQDYLGGRSIHFRVFCLNGDIVIEHRSSHGPDENWKVLRLAHIELESLRPKASQIEFSENDVLGIHSMAGVYVCSPSLNDEKVTSYAIFHFLSLKHCDEYERGVEAYSSQDMIGQRPTEEKHEKQVDFEPYYKQENVDVPTIEIYEMI